MRHRHSQASSDVRNVKFLIDAIAVHQLKAAQLDHQDHVVIQETKDPMDQTAKTDHLVFPELLPNPHMRCPLLASIAHRDHLDHLDLTESLEKPAHQETLAHRDVQENPAHQAQLANQESLDLQDPQAVPVSQDPQAKMASAERDRKDQKAHLDPVDHPESQAKMARRVPMESLETKVQTEDLDAMDVPERMAAQDQLAAQDCLVQMHTTARARHAAAYSFSRNTEMRSQLIHHNGLHLSSTEYYSKHFSLESCCFFRKNKQFHSAFNSIIHIIVFRVFINKLNLN